MTLPLRKSEREHVAGKRWSACAGEAVAAATAMTAASGTKSPRAGLKKEGEDHASHALHRATTTTRTVAAEGTRAPDARRLPI
jgi:hypothetical protein